jgi:uncharacterized protein (TIGR03437 family)
MSFRIAFIWLLLAAAIGLYGQTVTAALAVVGTEPSAVVVNPVTNKVYVASDLNSQPDSGYHLTVIDGATNTTSYIHTQNPLDPFTVSAVVDTLTNKVYVEGENEGDVTIIDGVTGSTSAVSILSPAAIGLNTVTNKIYVATNLGNLVVIDGQTTATTQVSAGTAMPMAVAVNESTNKVYVADYSANDVLVLDGATNSTTKVAVGMSPADIAVNPSTNTIYVANSESNTVSVIDGATNEVISTIGVGAKPIAVVVNPQLNKVYIANYVSNSLSVISGASNVLSDTVPTGNGPTRIALNTVSNQVYVTDSSGNRVTIVDGSTDATRTVVTGFQPDALAVDSATNKIYVANSGDNTVSVIDANMTITNGASYESSPAAPNTIMSLFGTNLSCAATLQVQINGTESEVLGAVATQINFVVPPDLAMISAAIIQVVCDDDTVQTTSIATAPAVPAIFTAAQSGTGQGSILNQDSTVNSSSSPAARGSYVSFYGTGFGVLGDPGPDGLRRLTDPVTAFFGGAPSPASYAGEAPGYTLGLQQINVQVPPNVTPNSNVPVVLLIGQVTTQAGVTLAVK